MSVVASAAFIRLPVWRARFVLALLLAAFGVLVGRAVYLQAIDTDFLQMKGESRFSRVLRFRLRAAGFSIATARPWRFPRR